MNKIYGGLCGLSSMDFVIKLRREEHVLAAVEERSGLDEKVRRVPFERGEARRPDDGDG